MIMISYGQKTLNKKDVRLGTWRFIGSFLVLSAISFLVVFFFFKSAQMQNRDLRKDLDAYHDMVGRNNLLKIKIDSIYYKMTLLNNNKVANDIFLRNQIIEDMSVCKQMIGEDSISELRHYSMLLDNLAPILAHKNELMKLKTDETSISRQLEECLGKVQKVNTQIKVKQKKQEVSGRLAETFRNK